jgi:hypothetical protein
LHRPTHVLQFRTMLRDQWANTKRRPLRNNHIVAAGEGQTRARDA